MDADFAEVNDLSESMPEQVAIMESAWLREAEANHVLPLFDTLTSRFAALLGPRWPTGQRAIYEPAGGPVFDEVLPLLLGGFVLTAEIDPAVGDGVIAALGDRHGGFSLVIVDGRLEFTLSDAERVITLRSPHAVPEPTTRLGVAFVPGQPGSLSLLIEDGPVATCEYNSIFPVAFQHGGAHLRLGYDVDQPVSSSYEAPFRLDGTVRRVIVDTGGDVVASAAELLRAALHAD